jgi:hypothetical protein
MRFFAAFTLGLILALSVAPVMSGAPGSKELQDRRRITVKFKLQDYAVLVPGKIGNGKPIQIVIDTGSAETILHTSLTKRLNLKPQEEVQIALSDQTMTAKRITVDQFEIGPLVFTNQSMLTADLSRFSAGLHTTIDLIVGYNVLCGLDSFEIDYTAKLLSLVPGVAGERNHACETHSLPILEAFITGRESPLRLLVDTASKGLMLVGEEHEYGASNIDGSGGARLVKLPGLTKKRVELPDIDFGGGTLLKNPHGYLLGPRPPHLFWIDGFIGGGGGIGLSLLRIDTRNQRVRLTFRGVR